MAVQYTIDKYVFFLHIKQFHSSVFRKFQYYASINDLLDQFLGLKTQVLTQIRLFSTS